MHYNYNKKYSTKSNLISELAVKIGIETKLLYALFFKCYTRNIYFIFEQRTTYMYYKAPQRQVNGQHNLCYPRISKISPFL